MKPWRVLFLCSRHRLQPRHEARLRGKRVVCPDVPGLAQQQPERVELLLRKAGPLLR